MNRALFDVAMLHAAAIKRPLSQLVEDALLTKLDEDGVMNLGEIAAKISEAREASRNAIEAAAREKAARRSGDKYRGPGYPGRRVA